jgi:transcriptional antiterminator NusG
MDESFESNKKRIFRLGDKVRILSGPFTAFTGKIEGINQSRALLKVKVSIYGRSTPIKLKFSEVEVIAFR